VPCVAVLSCSVMICLVSFTICRGRPLAADATWIQEILAAIFANYSAMLSHKSGHQTAETPVGDRSGLNEAIAPHVLAESGRALHFGRFHSISRPRRTLAYILVSQQTLMFAPERASLGGRINLSSGLINQFPLSEVFVKFKII